MTTTDYLINGLFVLVVLRQSRERVLDRRSIVVPLVLVFFVAQMYLHSIPTAGNDLRVRRGVCLGRCRARPSFGVRYPRSCRRRRSCACAGRLDRGPAADRGNRFADGVCVCDQPWCRARGPQLQHRPSDRRRGVAGGTGRNGALRGYDPDRDGAASWPPHDGCSAGSCDARDALRDAAWLPARFGGPDGVLSFVCGEHERRVRAGRGRAVPGREQASATARDVAAARARADRGGRRHGDQRPSGSGGPRSRAGSRRGDRRVRARARIRDPGLVHQPERRRPGCSHCGYGGGRRCARRAAAARGNRPRRRRRGLDGGRPLAARARSCGRRGGRGRLVRRAGAVRRLVGGRRRNGAPVRAPRGHRAT